MNLTLLTQMSAPALESISIADAIATAYPTVEVRESAPGCWGHSGDFHLRGETLTVPSGNYSSRKHYHRASSCVMEVESARRRLNVRPLFLLEGRAWNGDYGSMKKTYFLFGANEDGSFFLHKIRPNAGTSLEAARRWMWALRDDEEIAQRQGDLAFVTRNRRISGTVLDMDAIVIENHTVHADTIRTTTHKVFVENPRAVHAEHGETSQLAGWFECRLARQWQLGYGD